MITQETIIFPLNFSEWRVPACDVARQIYEKRIRESTSEHDEVSFDDDLQDYMRNGLVISRPDIFGMAKLIAWQGRLAWFVRMAVGDLATLVAELPLRTEKICFCRDKSDGLRIHAWPMGRMLRLAIKRKDRK